TVPTDQPGRQHGCDPDARAYAEPPFQLLVFGVVGRLSSFLVLKPEDAIRHERDDREEDGPGDPECQADRVVNVAPVGGNRRPPPRAVDVKQHRADCYQEQYDRYSHPSCIPAIEGCGYASKSGAHTYLRRWS